MCSHSAGIKDPQPDGTQAGEGEMRRDTQRQREERKCIKCKDKKGGYGGGVNPKFTLEAVETCRGRP